mgnify:CR=1 FL=1
MTEPPGKGAAAAGEKRKAAESRSTDAQKPPKAARTPAPRGRIGMTKKAAAAAQKAREAPGLVNVSKHVKFPRPDYAKPAPRDASKKTLKIPTKVSVMVCYMMYHV